MKVVVLTEGDAEFRALPLFLDQLNALSPHTVMRPLKVPVQPDAPPGVIAKACKSRVAIAVAQGADLVIVLLDREQQAAHPGTLAAAVESALAAHCGGARTRVVYKDRLFENWLVADLDALAAQPKRFSVTAARRRRVEPNKADSIDAMTLIKSMALGKGYDKVADAEKICRKIDVPRAAMHSRSLRHFLHVLEVTAYSSGCKAAAAP